MTNRRVFIGSALALPFLARTMRPAFAASSEIFNTGGIAIHGYDPVAYFEVGEPVDGKDEHALRWMGVSWRFSSAKNMAMFEADPHAFEPRYGGYCAYAMSKGAIATSVPEAWTIHNGQLYLNFSQGVREIWRKDKDGNIKLADGFWPEVLNN